MNVHLEEHKNINLFVSIIAYFKKSLALLSLEGPNQKRMYGDKHQDLRSLHPVNSTSDMLMTPLYTTQMETAQATCKTGMMLAGLHYLYFLK